MFRQFLQQLTAVAGSGVSKWLLISAPVVLFSALLIFGASGWRKRLASLAEGTGWRSWIAAGLTGSLQLSTGLLAVGFLCLALLVQAGLFTERHGRVTERNLDAVKSKWGVAHEQHELSVKHVVWELVTLEEFAGGGKRRVSESANRMPSNKQEEEVLSDEVFPADLDDDGKPKNPTAVAHRVKKLASREVPQDSVVAAQADIDLRSNPRFLGGAGYAGFEDTCVFQYTVVNRAAQQTHAVFKFPLPAEGHGVFNKLALKLDGRDLAGEVRYDEGALLWEMDMPAGAKHNVEIRYQSRGLEYLRYYPGPLRERCTVQLRVRGIPHERLNFPIGSMSPADDLNTLEGEDYTLHWDLARAVTNLSLGVIVPAPQQPGIEVARILREAPAGLALLSLMLLLTRMLIGSGAGLFAAGLSVLAHYLAYICFANVSDLTNSFGWAILTGMALPAFAGAAFWIGHDGWNLSGIQSGALHLLFTLGYPLAVWAADYSGTILNSSCVLLTAYLMFLVLMARRRNARG